MRTRQGTDNFILHVRKSGRASRMTNTSLARLISSWLRRHANGLKLEGLQPCPWRKDGGCVGEFGLPKTAAQFEFDTSALPNLFWMLDQLPF